MADIRPSMEKDKAILLTDSANAADIAPAFIDAVAKHRHPSRDLGTIT